MLRRRPVPAKTDLSISSLPKRLPSTVSGSSYTCFRSLNKVSCYVLQIWNSNRFLLSWVSWVIFMLLTRPAVCFCKLSMLLLLSLFAFLCILCVIHGFDVYMMNLSWDWCYYVDDDDDDGLEAWLYGFWKARVAGCCLSQANPSGCNYKNFPKKNYHSFRMEFKFPQLNMSPGF